MNSKQKQEITVKKFLLECKKHYSKFDYDLIYKAYEVAKKIHSNEKRKSGAPYITHPIAVAYYIVQENLDAPTVAAALLHDTVENSTYSNKYILRNFGGEIAMLVDGLTKLNKVNIKNKWKFPHNIIAKLTGKEKKVFEQHVDNLRKMCLAMTQDVRIIIIKLADRLHNMQTLKHLTKDKQYEIAQQTLEIYAPIAYRLGMGEIKGKLEDLAFPYIYPKQYHYIKNLAQKYYPKKVDYIQKLKKITQKELNKNKIKAHINGRKKHYYSLFRKLQRYDNDINKIYDLIALRIIVENTATCYKVLGLIHKKYKPLLGRIKDYIALPKPNGYRSLHTTVFGPDGEIVEIQIRTEKMHEQAEYGVAAHWHYSKNKSSKEEVFDIPRQQIDWLNELAKWHEKITDPEEWTNGLKMDFFKDQIFVYTPQGDVYNLPADSTPIDFAYAIHSEVGNSCKGVKVNEKIVKLNHILQNGDIVEIINDKNNKNPRKDWLRFVKSHKAKDEIKSFFN